MKFRVMNVNTSAEIILKINFNNSNKTIIIIFVFLFDFFSDYENLISGCFEKNNF